MAISSVGLTPDYFRLRHTQGTPTGAPGGTLGNLTDSGGLTNS